MNNNDEYKVMNKQLQDGFNALAILMNNQTQSQEDITNAVERSMQLHQTIEHTVRQFIQDVPNTIKGAAETSANIVSTKVIGDLQDLDKKAQQTADTLAEAAKKLKWKIIIINWSVLALCFVMMLIFVICCIPTFDEIENRRAELTYLEHSIQNLEAQGARASLTNCPVGKKKMPCIRTDETKHKLPFRSHNGKEEQTFRLIYQIK
ncbi:TrbL/VirB6 plasmid conjugal transfer protein [Snodgrassella alvi SCGC AB-598-O02]|nr:TrbL/VirB6 plasmid conjugal transfer protein [Snodgrassella alvi SCGC AB-598-O02]